MHSVHSPSAIAFSAARRAGCGGCRPGGSMAVTRRYPAGGLTGGSVVGSHTRIVEGPRFAQEW